jgi:hypothetical protein
MSYEKAKELLQEIAEFWATQKSDDVNLLLRTWNSFGADAYKLLHPHEDETPPPLGVSVAETIQTEERNG